MITNYNGNSGNQSPKSPFSSLINLVMAVAVIALVFLMVRGFIKLLYFAAPILLILALIVNHKVVLKYVSDLGATFRRDVLTGIVWVLFAVFCYPFLFLWLLLKAVLLKKVEQLHQSFQNEPNPFNQKIGGNSYTDYEELDSKPTMHVVRDEDVKKRRKKK